MLKEQEDRIAIGRVGSVRFGSGLPMQTNIDDCAAAGDSSAPCSVPLPRPARHPSPRRQHLCEPAIAQAFRHTIASRLLPWRDKCVAISATDATRDKRQTTNDKRQTRNVSWGCACAKYLSTGAHSTRRHVASVRLCSWRRAHPGTSLGPVGQLQQQLHTQIAVCNALGRLNAGGAYGKARGVVCKGDS